jgi:hypothetical protein
VGGPAPRHGRGTADNCLRRSYAAATDPAPRAAARASRRRPLALPRQRARLAGQLARAPTLRRVRSAVTRPSAGEDELREIFGKARLALDALGGPRRACRSGCDPSVGGTEALPVPAPDRAHGRPRRNAKRVATRCSCPRSGRARPAVAYAHNVERSAEAGDEEAIALLIRAARTTAPRADRWTMAARRVAAAGPRKRRRRALGAAMRRPRRLPQRARPVTRSLRWRRPSCW